MAATTQVQIINGASSGTAASAESGFRFGKDDSVTSGTAISKPTTSTSINYSWYKTLFLNVTSGGGTTSILNRKVRFATSPTTGLTGFFKDGGSTAYGSTGITQATSGTQATVVGADSTSSSTAVPSGTAPTGSSSWAALSTSFQTWDSASASATNSTRNGKYLLLCLGVSDLYTAGAGSAISLPNIEVQYDEQ